MASARRSQRPHELICERNNRLQPARFLQSVVGLELTAAMREDPLLYTTLLA